MPKKAANSNDLMTTIARGVGSAVGKIANTAQRLATASSEVVQQARTQGKKKTRPSTAKKAIKKVAARKPKTKAKKKTSRARA